MSAPVITLSSKDGYTAKEQRILNNHIIQYRDRWRKASVQPVSQARIQEGIQEKAGLITGSYSYSFDHLICSHAYINTQGLSTTVAIPVIDVGKEIQSFSVSGNQFSPYTEEGSLSHYINFTKEGSVLYAQLLEETTAIFDAYITITI